MTKLVFQTNESILTSPHCQVLAETLQFITDTITAYRLIDLPDEVTVSLRLDPFEDDNDDKMSIAGCSVKHNLIEIRVPPCYTVQTLVTFIHELVHIGQGNQGWLREVGEGFMWFHKYYSIEGLSYDEYMELPWEIQAFREQNEIWNVIKHHVYEYAQEEKEEPDPDVTVHLVS